jgi:dTDP-4-dehydrorhamnose 3,5-epimerase
MTTTKPEIITVAKTNLKNVLLFQLKHHEDHRGTYTRLCHRDDYRKIIKKQTGEDVEFIEDDYAYSSKHVLRGIHGDDRTWKLVTCLYGKFYIVVVNCSESSKDFGKWQKFILTRENGKQLLIPPNYGHAYQVLSDEAVFHYRQSSYYKGKTRQFTYKWDDPRFKIWWPVKNPILSQRDELGYVPENGK